MMRDVSPVICILLLTLALLTSACGENAGPTLTVDSDATVADRTDVDAAGEARVSRQRSSGSVADRIRDAQTETRVLLALADDARLSTYPFTAEVVAGEVVLSGNVETQSEQQHAVQVANSVDGVRRVVNGITFTEAVASESAPAEGSTNGRAPETPQAAATPEAAFHTVQSGESLWAISRRHGVSVDEIRRLNNLQGNNVRPGQRLRVR